MARLTRTSPLWQLLLYVTCSALRLPWRSARPPAPVRVGILGGGFAGLTAARTLAAHRRVQVVLIDQRDYFEYTPGILRAWVMPSVHERLVNPIRRLLRSRRARFERVPPGCQCLLEAEGEGGELRLSILEREGGELVSEVCDYVVLATGGELSPVSDDRQTVEGTITARRKRFNEQVP